MLKYFLVKNPLTSGAANCIAYVSRNENKSLDDVIDFMIAEGSGLTRPQALAYFEKLTETIMYFVGEGHSVSTPLFHVRPTISGLFEDFQDNFDSTRHQINIRTSTGARMRTFSNTIKAKKSIAKSQDPFPSTFVDAVTGKSNLNATAGGIAVLFGKRLRFDPFDAQQGIFFSPVHSPEIEVRVTSYSGIKPSEIHFQVPSLEQGEYLITVKTMKRNGKIINTGKLNESIIV